MILGGSVKKKKKKKKKTKKKKNQHRVENTPSDKIIGYYETTVIQSAKEIIKDFKGKYRLNHLRGKEM